MTSNKPAAESPRVNPAEVSLLARLLTTASALLLGALYFLPIWRINLEAPQYPEGISLLIKLRTVAGGKEFDLQNLNMLNHYIGMKAIVPDSIPELKYMQWIVGALILTGLIAAMIGKRRVLFAWVGSFATVGVAGLLDFYRWGYDYGHNLDVETAVIKVPGMTYQPPLIGTKQLLNFTAHSWPDLGGIAAGAAFLLAVAALVLAYKSRKPRKTPAANALPARASTVDDSRAGHGIAKVRRTESVVSAVALATMLALPLEAQIARSDTVRVSPHGVIQSVTRALELVRRGGVVLIMPGVYQEPMIAVTAPVSIEGVGNPVLDGQNTHQVLSIGADSVSVHGITFRNTGSSFVEDRAAIKITGARDCSITANRIENGFFGIYLASVSNCTITGNVLSASNPGESSSGNGIHLWSSREITIADNKVSGFRDGIYFEFVRASRIERNISEGNLRYGLHFMYSDSCRYSSNTYRRNLAGVAVMYTKTVEMTGNTFADNWGSSSYGLLLKEISDATLRGNIFSGNTTGILADGAVRILAEGNDFRNNGWALRLMASTYDGRFTANNFAGNTFDVAVDSDDASNTFAGNHFDGYRGYDLNHDGAGDIPHYPVRLFSLIAARHPLSLILLRSFLLDLLDMTERVLPSLVPAGIVDPRPAMHRVIRA